MHAWTWRALVSKAQQMAQVKFSDCRAIGWRQYRPYNVPPFLGGFTPVLANRPVDWCKWAEPDRRRDMKQKYGSDVPQMNSANCDMWGIGIGRADSYTNASTAEGSVKLPVNFQEGAFSPTVATLDFLTHSADTRLQAKPERYFR